MRKKIGMASGAIEAIFNVLWNNFHTDGALNCDENFKSIDKSKAALDD